MNEKKKEKLHDFGYILSTFIRNIIVVLYFFAFGEKLYLFCRNPFGNICITNTKEM